MPTKQSHRQVRCVECRNTSFVEHDEVTLRTPLRLTRIDGETVAEQTEAVQILPNARKHKVVCANCGTPAMLPNEPVAIPVIESIETTHDQIRALHFFLWPDQYSADKQALHRYQPEPGRVYEWNSDTAEAVGEIAADLAIGIRGIPQDGDSA